MTSDQLKSATVGELPKYPTADDIKKASTAALIEEMVHSDKTRTISHEILRRFALLDGALEKSISAMRAPLDAWKGNLECAALDEAHNARREANGGKA